MDFSHYTDESVQIAVDLVNSLELASGEERLREPEDVRRLLVPYEDHWPHPDWKLTKRDLHEVRALRERLRDVFTASDEEVAADVLNGLLADVAAIPRVSVHHGRPHLHFDSHEALPARWIGAVAAMGLSMVLCDYGLSRLGVCASSTCEDVFIDSSRNRSRRHCSDTCTTRENVAAYRERIRQAAADD